MNYVKFLFKQILKNKLSYVPLVLVLVACLGTLFLNNRTYQMNNLGTMARQNAIDNTKILEDTKKELESLDKSSEEYPYFTRTIEIGEQLVEFDFSRAEAFDNNDWDKLYDLELEALQRAKDSGEFDKQADSLQEAVNRDILKFQHLSELDIPYEDEYMPTTSVQFILSLFRYILPTLLPVGCAYVLSNLYGSRFIGQLNTNRLFPHSEKSVVVKDIVTGATYSLLTLGAILIPTVLISGIAFGFGHLNYPILFYRLSDGELYFDSVGKVILPTIGLHALSLVFISILIYLVTIVTKNKMTALFVSTVALLSGIILPSVLAPVSIVAHLIPTTYVRSFDITTGVFQHAIENYKVNTGLGVLVLIGSSLVLLAIIFLLQGKGKRLEVVKGM